MNRAQENVDDAASERQTRAAPLPPSAKALPPAPPPPRRSRGWIWLLASASAGFVGVSRVSERLSRRTPRQRPRRRRAPRIAPCPVAATPARRGDLPIYLRGLGTVDAYNTVNVRARVDGPIIAVHVQGRPDRQQGATAGRDRPADLPGRRQSGRGTAGARPGAAPRCRGEPGAISGAVVGAGVIAKQQLDTQAAAGRPVRGRHRGGPGGHRERPAATRLHEGDRADQRPHRTAAGGRREHRARQRSERRMAVITQMQPIAVLFTIPADNLPPVLAKLRAGAKLPVDAYDRADQQPHRDGHAGNGG